MRCHRISATNAFPTRRVSSDTRPSTVAARASGSRMTANSPPARFALRSGLRAATRSSGRPLLSVVSAAKSSRGRRCIRNTATTIMRCSSKTATAIGTRSSPTTTRLKRRHDRAHAGRNSAVAGTNQNRCDGRRVRQCVAAELYGLLLSANADNVRGRADQPQTRIDRRRQSISDACGLCQGTWAARRGRRVSPALGCIGRHRRGDRGGSTRHLVSVWRYQRGSDRTSRRRRSDGRRRPLHKSRIRTLVRRSCCRRLEQRRYHFAPPSGALSYESESAELDTTILGVIDGWRAGSETLDNGAFNDLALRLFHYQRRYNEPYARFCASLGFSNDTMPASWERIPPVPAAA